MAKEEEKKESKDAKKESPDKKDESSSEDKNSPQEPADASIDLISPGGCMILFVAVILDLIGLFLFFVSFYSAENRCCRIYFID